MRRKLTVFFLGLCLIQFSNAQSFKEVNPEDVGFISERLTRIDETVTKSFEKGEIPGAVALVARKGKIAYHKSFGYADIASKKQMEKDAIFRIASMSKAVTTIGIMILYERGFFLLNDRVSKFLPKFKNPNILVELDTLENEVKTEPSEKEIRIIDLLTHSSGISYPFIKNDLQQIQLRRQSGCWCWETP